MIGGETRLEAALTAEAELISDLVVIGGGAAGMTAASRARRLQPDWRITVFERGDYVSSVDSAVQGEWQAHRPCGVRERQDPR